MYKRKLDDTIRDLEHLLGAIRGSLQHGGSFLVNRRAPHGPIMREPNLSYVHKATWGMYAAGVDHTIISELLDWANDNALQPNCDFYVLGEGPGYKDLQRAYRPLTFLKVAAWIEHPLARDEKVVTRLLQYQHASGGVFNYIGDDPSRIEEQPTIGTLNTSFFGQLMIALDVRDEAVRAGRWLCDLVEANHDHMRQEGLMYVNMTPQGELVTDIKPGQRISSVVDNRQPKQEFWQVGTVMAYLAVLYDVARERWGHDILDLERYLHNALELLDFEATMPLYTYLWPSKCKVGWGAGELLRILVKYRRGISEQVEKAYEVAKKVAVFTFMDNQLPNGGWSCMHYPTSELDPELAFDYKPLRGLINVPDHPLSGSQALFLPGEEITGEFLGEMKSIEMGVQELLDQYREERRLRGNHGVQD